MARPPLPTERVSPTEDGGLTLRYGTRPPLSAQRLREAPDRRLVIRFKGPLPDGSTEVTQTTKELIRRLSAVVAPPGFRLTGFHGLFASHSRWRKRSCWLGRWRRATTSRLRGRLHPRNPGTSPTSTTFLPYSDREPKERHLREPNCCAERTGRPASLQKVWWPPRTAARKFEGVSVGTLWKPRSRRVVRNRSGAWLMAESAHAKPGA
jgi:hypothetical protein